MSMPDIHRQLDDGGSKKPLSNDFAKSKRSHLTPSSQEAKHWAKQYRTEIAAGSSSVLSTFAAVGLLYCESRESGVGTDLNTQFPLDSIKTRMQAYRFNHFTDCVQHTYKTEGFQGFWRGVLAPLASVTLVRTISFSIYQKAKYKYSSVIGQATGQDEPLVVVNRPGSVPTLSTIACFSAAGATAGGIITVVACPFELTKLSAQISVLMARTNSSSMDDPVRRSYAQKGTFATAKNIVLNRGLSGLYSGFHLHLLRDTIGTAIYFSTYESSKQLLVKLQGRDSPTAPSSVAIAGGLCGVVSWVCIYPIDSTKTHYQRNCLTKSKGQSVAVAPIQFFNKGMYRGLGVSIARSCIINTIFFSSFELVKKRINQLEDPIA